MLASATLVLACAEGAGEGAGSGTTATSGSGGTMDAAATSGNGGDSTSASVGGSAGAGMGGATASSASTGGSANCTMSTQCAVTEYCDFPDDQCGAGAPGSCVPRPSNCMNVYDPQCGCNQMQYSNACFAAVAGQDVDVFGLCN